jgi:hypothetical protein
MAAIVEFTKFDRNAVDEGVGVVKLFNLATQPGTVFIQIDGTNPFQIGDTITYAKGDIVFSGKVRSIFVRMNSLMVDHPNFDQFNGITGGVVYSGIIDTSKVSASSENQVFESAATILHGSEAGDSIETPDGTVISSESEPSIQPNIAVNGINTTKTLITIFGVITGLYLLSYIFKSKRK